jgi:uncharacterized protein with beta-barrel porin domain
MRLRNAMLAGVSTLALGLALGHPGQAVAQVGYQWTGGDLSIPGSGGFAGTTAIANTGSSGTLTNSGTISGGNVGVNNLGTIRALENGGTISAGNSGVGNYGRIDTLTNTGTIIFSGGSGNSYGVQNSGSIGTLTNSGTISTGSIGANNSRTIDVLNNTIGGTISGSIRGIYNNGGSIRALTNSGTISSNGVGLNNNGGTIDALTNTIGGVISGGSTGIYNSSGGSIRALTNNGTISAGHNTGIANYGTIGTLKNSGTIISSGSSGVYNAGSIGTLTNSGTISGGILSVNGVNNTGKIGALSNTIGGTISALDNSGTIGIGGATGIVNSGSIGTLTNRGSISGGTRSSGIYNDGGSIGALTNTIGGVINGGATGIRNDGGTIGTLTNSGTISGGDRGVNVSTTDGGTIISSGSIGALTNNGFISGPSAVANSGTIRALTNSGTISGGWTGIISTGSIGTLNNNIGGTISGNVFGVLSGGTIGALNNTIGGTISGGSYGIYNDGGSIGALTNSGTIISSGTGVYNNGGTIDTLNNTIGGAIISSGSTGIYNSGSIGTLTNSGFIGGDGAGINNDNTGKIGTLTNTIGGSISALNNSGTIGIGGGLTGVRNLGGGIGALTNSGSISGNWIGILNNGGGSIGALNNTIGGSIRGGQIGVSNDGGSIGALTNSGTISGGNWGLANAGTIDTLTNSGIISGDSSHGIANWWGSRIGALNNTIGGTISSGGSGVYNSGGTIGTLDNSGIISGGTIGVHNFAYASSGSSVVGSIGALTNNGVISGGSHGIFNEGGSIGALNNTIGGTISGGSIGVYNASFSSSGLVGGGTIGALTNSGTISAPVAIFNDANSTLGPITNSGVIAGNIVNNSANGLTINGGSGTVFGTLTGYNGAIGTITNTASNLNFASGNLLLNDNIVATGHTVTNTGATLRLDNTVSITGTYNQTGGGLISTATGNGASNTKLMVDGDATVTNSTITVSGAGLSAGQKFTIVDATDGHAGTYTNDTARVAVTNGLGATVSTEGNDLVVTLTGGNSANTYTAKGAAAGGAAAPLGSTLDGIRNSNTPEAVAFQQTVLAALDALPESAQGAAIKQLAPSQGAPAAQMSNTATGAVVGAIEQHQQTAMAYGGETGAAAGSDARDTTLWGQFLGGGARRGSNAEADGYRLMDFGIATGIDHHFTPDALGGVALSWMRAWTQGSDNSSGSSSILDSYQLTFYGTYRLDRAYVDGQLGFGWNHFDQKRAIAFLGSTAEANYDGRQYLARAEVGYDVPVGGVTVTPLAALRWLRSETNAYDETGAGNANLSVDSASTTSVTQDLGAKVAWTMPTSLGTLSPEVRLAWVHDYTNAPIATTSSLLGGQATTTTAPRTEPNGVRIGLAGELKEDDLTLRAEYEGELRAQYQSHTALVKAMWAF